MVILPLTPSPVVGILDPAITILLFPVVLSSRRGYEVIDAVIGKKLDPLKLYHSCPSVKVLPITGGVKLSTVDPLNTISATKATESFKAKLEDALLASVTILALSAYNLILHGAPETDCAFKSINVPPNAVVDPLTIALLVCLANRVVLR